MVLCDIVQLCPQTVSEWGNDSAEVLGGPFLNGEGVGKGGGARTPPFQPSHPCPLHLDWWWRWRSLDAWRRKIVK